MALVDKVGTWISDIYLSSVFLEQVAFTGAGEAAESYERVFALCVIAAVASVPATRSLMCSRLGGVTVHSLASAGLLVVSASPTSFLLHWCGAVAVAMAWFGRMYFSEFHLDDPEVRRQTLSLPLGFVVVVIRRFLSDAALLLSHQAAYDCLRWAFVLFCCAVQWRRSRATAPTASPQPPSEPESTLCEAARWAPVSPLIVGGAMAAAATATQSFLLGTVSNAVAHLSAASNSHAQSTLLVAALFLFGVYKSTSLFPSACDGARTVPSAVGTVASPLLALAGVMIVALRGHPSTNEASVNGAAGFLLGAAWPLLLEAGNDWAASHARHHERRAPWVAVGFAMVCAATANDVLCPRSWLIIAPLTVVPWYVRKQYRAAAKTFVTERPSVRTLDASGRTLCAPVFGCLFSLLIVSYIVACI